MPKCRGCQCLKEEAHGPHQAGCFPGGLYRKWLSVRSLDEEQECDLYLPASNFDPAFLEMCLAAPELQTLRGPGKWQNGDRYVCLDLQQVAYDWTDSEDEPYEKFHPVWLPGLQHLFGMVQHHFTSPQNMFILFGQWLGNFPKLHQFPAECLCLIFVMHKNYHKQWISGKWESE